ncbi:FitA-like ribbon-helix-helix domain-containing protein [Leucobacter tenebrionis]|uniref:FitA-like ribbon-helix-helix domain-containing protein n=1 Tax=Leucobacter tenebrionis TaxID=2873270 RepID=UPI001CA79E21|nr:Arc family DNA-binding protein [Leucobacter tenebrionis]QZY53271.1 Arc family DNA-binding protein [Leucobacter tenebrionis]
MAQLLIRNLPDEVKESLRERAKSNGRSMEAEARKILVDFIQSAENIVVEYEGPYSPEAIFERFGVKMLPKNRPGRAITFEETQALIDEFV